MTEQIGEDLAVREEGFLARLCDSRFGDELIVGLLGIQMRRLYLYAAACMYKHVYDVSTSFACIG